MVQGTLVFTSVFNIGHVCDSTGCKSVIVLDGNMKSAREVCACKNV